MKLALVHDVAEGMAFQRLQALHGPSKHGPGPHEGHHLILSGMISHCWGHLSC